MQIVISARVLLLNARDELLLVTHPGENFWYTAGGRWIETETLEESAIREVYEETGLKIKIEKLIYINEFISTHREEPRKHLAFFFFARTDLTMPEKWTDPGGEDPIIAKFLSQNEIQKQAEVYPEFIKTDFWRDLKNNFANYEVYKKT
jgi:8-oxo-dGTP diphosphatase